MICRMICLCYKPERRVGSSRYSGGQKHCRHCDLFIKWEGLWCPCCGYRLRTKPRHSKYKAKLRIIIKQQKEEKEKAKAKRVLATRS